MTELNEAAKQALQDAAEALYFNDNSDFRSYFWQIVKALLPHFAPEFNPKDFDECDLRTLLQKLDPDTFEDFDDE